MLIQNTSQNDCQSLSLVSTLPKSEVQFEWFSSFVRDYSLGGSWTNLNNVSGYTNKVVEQVTWLRTGTFSVYSKEHKKLYSSKNVRGFLSGFEIRIKKNKKKNLHYVGAIQSFITSHTLKLKILCVYAEHRIVFLKLTDNNQGKQWQNHTEACHL